MRNWFRTLFPPSEVRLAIEASKTFFSRCTALSQEMIEPEVVSQIKDVEMTLYSIRNKQMKPDQLALLHITHVVRRHLASGSQHIYLGVLSAVGADMLAVWHTVQAERVEYGYATESEVEEEDRWLKEKINSAGRHRGESQLLKSCFAC